MCRRASHRILLAERQSHIASTADQSARFGTLRRPSSFLDDIILEFAAPRVSLTKEPIIYREFPIPPGVAGDRPGGSVWNSRRRVCPKLHTERNRQPVSAWRRQFACICRKLEHNRLSAQGLIIFRAFQLWRARPLSCVSTTIPGGYKRREAHP